MVIRPCCKDKKKKAAGKKMIFTEAEQNPDDPYFSYAQIKQIVPIKVQIQKELKLPAPEECEPDENANLKTGQMLKIQAEHCEVYEVGSDYEIVIDQEGRPGEDSVKTTTTNNTYTLSDYETEVEFPGEQQTNELQSDEGVASQQDGDASLMAQAKQDSQRSPSKSPTTMTVKKATKSLNYSGYGATAETPASIYGTTN